MPSAEIIAIGSELLLGETLDTNTQFLLQNFREIGIDVYRTMIIGDNPERISQVVREAFGRSDIVITTGGLGPTVDDPTRGAVSLAFDCELVYSAELWEEIQAYFRKMQWQPTINNKRQAYLPAIASPISNPTGTAPAFYILKNNKLVVSLPGVPREMKYLFTHSVIPLIQETFREQENIVMRNLHSYGLGESLIDDKVGELEKSANPTLGLCAKSGRIDLRITAKAENIAAAEAMADRFEAQLRDILGDAIFGKDEDTLQDVVSGLIQSNGVKLRILEINTPGHLGRFLPESAMIENQKLTSETPEEDIAAFLNAEGGEQPDTLSVILKLDSSHEERITANASVRFAGQAEDFTRTYNPLTVNEEDWILWTLNAMRILILHRKQS